MAARGGLKTQNAARWTLGLSAGDLMPDHILDGRDRN